MKRLIIALSITAMLGVIFPGLPILAQPALIPHENPNIAEGSLDKAGLLLSYSEIINLATKSQYRSAQDTLNELEHVDLPDEIRYVIDQYTKLLHSLLNTLDDLEALLDRASYLLDRNNVLEVQNLLDRSLADIDNAYTMLENIEVSTSSMSDILEVSSISATSQLQQAHMRLEESLERIDQLVSTLKYLNIHLTEQYDQKKKLGTTSISVDVNPSEAYVGDFVETSGRLTSEGNPVNGGKLTLYLDGKKVTSTRSGWDGSFAVYIMLPYIYKESANLIMVYEPEGADIGTYLSSSSPPITIHTRYYPTRLELSTSTGLHPGLPIIVSGKISSNNENRYRNITVFLDEYILVDQTTSAQFNLEIMPPEKITPGPGTLTVAVSPIGRYAGITERRSVTTSLIPMSFDIQTPSIIVLPGYIQIGGKVYNQIGPVKNASVSCSYMKSSTTVKTAADGSFTASLKAPLDLILVGPQEISIKVTPLESWATAGTVSKRIFIINPLTTGFIVMILIALCLVIWRRHKSPTRTEVQEPPEGMEKIPVITPPPAPVQKPKGIRGQVLLAYESVITAVEKITGVIMSPNITLREFLKSVRLPSPAATEKFTELTSIIEVTLYSAYAPRKDTVNRVQELAAHIKEELLGGTA